ncbi:MAG TPA: SpoIID/LytB domain-containing protein [Terracidiphilus sp.]|nr:SpoIID/LytB domain-containing protein [Terracidiphilus sp.]
MTSNGMVRTLASLFVAGCVMGMGARQGTPSSGTAASSARAPRETLSIGMWTLWRDSEVTLAPPGAEHKPTLRTCAKCATLVFREPFHAKAVGDGLTLTGAGKTGNARRLEVSGGVTLTAHGESVTLKSPVTISADAGALVIVVALPIETYVERVVASESSSADSAESLKALAIAVRSFALHETHGHAAYDLCDSTHCQLLHWGANGGREAAAHAAVLATASETLWFHGQRALAYFGKDCGGRTASSGEVWPRGKSVAYLPSQPDPFCTRDGGRDWASEIPRADLTAALASHGLAQAGWQNLAIARRGESGRAVTLRLDGREIPAEDFRLAVGESLGWNKIPSTWFEVSREGNGFAFHGRGWGNGVGLCQKGAAEMAAEGCTSREILAQYFPGAIAADEASGREWANLAGSGFVLETLDASDATFLPDLSRARAEATQRSGLNVSSPITVRAFASTDAYRAATLAEGWVAAFTEGDWIGTQPLRVLASRDLLADTMRHEFLHALVESQAGPRTPLWLREGLVEVWSEADAAVEGAIARKPAPLLMPDAVDSALAHASTETESEQAHRASEWYAAELLARYGRNQVIDWLHSGVPTRAVASLRQR